MEYTRLNKCDWGRYPRRHGREVGFDTFPCCLGTCRPRPIEIVVYGDCRVVDFDSDDDRLRPKRRETQDLGVAADHVPLCLGASVVANLHFLTVDTQDETRTVHGDDGDVVFILHEVGHDVRDDVGPLTSRIRHREPHTETSEVHLRLVPSCVWYQNDSHKEHLRAVYVRRPVATRRIVHTMRA